MFRNGQLGDENLFRFIIADMAIWSMRLTRLHPRDCATALTLAANRLASDPTGPSIFCCSSAQLGLNLQPAKRPGEFLVIDYVGRPSEN